MKGRGKLYKNIPKQEKILLKNLVEYRDGQVVSGLWSQNDFVRCYHFSFDKERKYQLMHQVEMPWLLYPGKVPFLVGGEVFTLTEGESLIMPKDVPHAVFGKKNSRWN